MDKAAGYIFDMNDRDMICTASDKFPLPLRQLRDDRLSECFAWPVNRTQVNVHGIDARSLDNPSNRNADVAKAGRRSRCLGFGTYHPIRIGLEIVGPADRKIQRTLVLGNVGESIENSFRERLTLLGDLSDSLNPKRDRNFRLDQIEQ